MIDVQETFVGAFVGALDRVGDPPVALTEAHNSYFAAVSEQLAVFHRISDRLADAGSDLNMGRRTQITPRLPESLRPECSDPPRTCLGQPEVFPVLAIRQVGAWTGRRGRVELHREHGNRVLVAA